MTEETVTKEESTTVLHDPPSNSMTAVDETGDDKSDGNTTMTNASKAYSKEDLTDLVAAVKFANPDASIRMVHREITEEMSKKESFEFLSQVKLNDVKKVWKKVMKKNAEQPQQEQILKFYTVGSNYTNVQMLAHEYTSSAQAAKQAAEEAAKLRQEEELLKNYVHVFLDVPADKSGTKPHQALINFNENDKNSNNPQPNNKQSSKDGRDIVKIQVAASLPGMVADTPMLLYNSNRTAKTFIHPPSPDNDNNNDDDDAYTKIKTLIQQQGVGGALGRTGGTKGYFYSRITKRKNGQDIISIDIASGLAPMQTW